MVLNVATFEFGILKGGDRQVRHQCRVPKSPDAFGRDRQFELSDLLEEAELLRFRF